MSKQRNIWKECNIITVQYDLKSYLLYLTRPTIPIKSIIIPTLQIWILNRHGRIQNILATYGYENTARFFSTVLCFHGKKTVKKHPTYEGSYNSLFFQNLRSGEDYQSKRPIFRGYFFCAIQGLRKKLFYRTD